LPEFPAIGTAASQKRDVAVEAIQSTHHGTDRKTVAEADENTLFSSTIAAYIGNAGSPAMTINGRRNKLFGPRGSTRRLHPSPPRPFGLSGGGLRRGRNRIDEGVKGEFLFGMVPPLSGYAIVANDNYAPVAQAA
jgi:hypothetical protein